MVLAVSCNPCIDRTLYLNQLGVGGHNRVEHLREDVAGKGINVLGVLRNLQIPCANLGFEFTKKGRPVADFLKELEIPFYSVDVAEDLRVNTKVFDLSSHQMTEINCNGPKLGEKEEEELMAKFREALSGASIVVANGSVPPGISSRLYEKMILEAGKCGVFTILDASGDLLKNGMKAGPDLVKPNRKELEEYLGCEIRDLNGAVKACQVLLDQGAKNVCLSLGGDGALLVNARESWFSEGLEIEVKSFQGAGDSMVAGMCYAIEQGMPASDWLRCGAAAAHGTILREGTLLCTKEQFEELLPQIPVRETAWN